MGIEEFSESFGVLQKKKKKNYSLSLVREMKNSLTVFESYKNISQFSDGIWGKRDGVGGKRNGKLFGTRC